MPFSMNHLTLCAPSSTFSIDSAVDADAKRSGKFDGLCLRGGWVGPHGGRAHVIVQHTNGIACCCIFTRGLLRRIVGIRKSSSPYNESEGKEEENSTWASRTSFQIGALCSKF